jgi:hypothetical protein
MKLQFSLATLLICMTVLAVVCAFAISVKVFKPAVKFVLPGDTSEHIARKALYRTLTVAEVTLRIVLWGASAIAATLIVLRVIGRLKSRRHTEPPVG